MYTREGLKDVNLLSHSLQQNQSRAFSTNAAGSRRSFATVPSYEEQALPIQKFDEEAYNSAIAEGFSDFEASLTLGGDDRSLIKEGVGTNKYHIKVS